MIVFIFPSSGISSPAHVKGLHSRTWARQVGRLEERQANSVLLPPTIATPVRNYLRCLLIDLPEWCTNKPTCPTEPSQFHHCANSNPKS